MKWLLFEGGGGEWNNLVSLSHVHAGCYQLYEWGEYKRQSGWTPFRIVGNDNDKKCVIQVLVKKNWLLSVIFVPGMGLNYASGLDDLFFKFIAQCVGTKNIYLRISFPMKGNYDVHNSLIKNKWCIPRSYIGASQSMLYDLSDSDDIRLANASKNWRHNLRRALKKREIIIKQATIDDVGVIVEIYRDMENNKNLDEQFSEKNILSMFNAFKQNFILYYATNLRGQLLGLRGAIFLGNNAVDFMAATTMLGRKTYSSYMLFWKLTQKCKSEGVLNYDMSGIDKENNKGVYNFKKGTGAEEILYLGEYEKSSGIVIKSIINYIISFRKR